MSKTSKQQKNTFVWRRSFLFDALRLLLFLVSISSSAYAELTTTTTTAEPTAYPAREEYFDTVLDHYNFRPTSPVDTFPLRYFVCDKFWRRDGGAAKEGDRCSCPNSTSSPSSGRPFGPVLFYAGNEDNVVQFLNHSGYMFELARDLEAMVVFAEHRYYGRSLPFGPVYSFGSPYNISFLTVEQAMADYNDLNVHLRRLYNMTTSCSCGCPRRGGSALPYDLGDVPFVVFGGSYGGNLALWLRLKNPNLWSGAVASSATPLKHLLRQSNGFARIETDAYGNVSSLCPDLVRLGYRQLYEMSGTERGRDAVRSVLGICERHDDDGEYDDDEEEEEDDSPFADLAHDWIATALETMVQYGYPYPTNYFSPLPGYPHRVACRNMLERTTTAAAAIGGANTGSGVGGGDRDTTGLIALRAAIDLYYNYTGQVRGDCYDVAGMGGGDGDGGMMRGVIRHLHRTGRHDAMMRYYRRRRRGGRVRHPRANGKERMIGGGVRVEAAAIIEESAKKRREGQAYPAIRASSKMPRSLERRQEDGSNVEDDEEDDFDRVMLAWGYQTCTEVYQPMPTDGITDFEVPRAPNATRYDEYCSARYDGVKPRRDWEELTYMSDNIGAGSNIFLTNGQIDPWRAAGIQELPRSGKSPPSSSSIVVRTISGGAHHYDLRASHPLDTASVRKVRDEQKRAVRRWIREWNDNGQC